VQPGRDRARLRGAHAGLAGLDGHVRRRLDLRPVEQSRIHRTGAGAGVCGSTVRFASRVSKLGKHIRSSRNSSMAGSWCATERSRCPTAAWYAMPRNYLDGGLIIGDSGSFLDSQRLKGIHLAMKSGMLAAETIFEALKAGDTLRENAERLPEKDRAKLTSRKSCGRCAIFTNPSSMECFADSFTPRSSRSPVGAA